MNFKFIDKLKKSNVTRKQLAYELGVSRGMITHWVVGRIKPVRIEHYLKMAFLFECDIKEVVEIFYNDMIINVNKK